MNINEINEYAYNRADSYSLEQRRDFFKSLKEYMNHSRVRIPTFELPKNGQNVIFQAGSGAVFLGEYINGRFLHLHGSYCISVVLGWTELPVFPKEVEHVLFHRPGEKEPMEVRYKRKEGMKNDKL